MKITYYVHDLSFPLREGVRKQAWWLAIAMKKLGHEVSIVSSSSKSKVINKDGIKIVYGNPLQISKIQTDILHYITHPTPLILPLLLRVKAKKQIMTMFDGNLNGFWKRPWYKVMCYFVNKKIDIITIQTDYQLKTIKNTKINNEVVKIPPLIPHFKRKCRRSKFPTLLYMSHLHPNKGVYEVIGAYNKIKKDIKDMKLIIANSSVTKNNKVLNYIKSLNDNNITIKEIVNPEKELAKAWVYIYPIKSPQETFSVPLSIIESIQVDTPWISRDVGGLKEYFEKKALIKVKKDETNESVTNKLSERIKYLIKKKKVFNLIKNIDNKKIGREFDERYRS